MTVLDLSVRKKPSSKVLSGEDVGLSYRNKFNLDDLDVCNDFSIVVTIPDDVYSLNQSFFFGLFGNSIKVLGEDLFSEKYVFDCDDLFKVIIKDYVKLISRRFAYEK